MTYPLFNFTLHHAHPFAIPKEFLQKNSSLAYQEFGGIQIFPNHRHTSLFLCQIFPNHGHSSLFLCKTRF